MDEVLHRIKANLYNNFLTDDPNDYSAKVISEPRTAVFDKAFTVSKLKI
jgi:hypothetical protein